MTIHILDCATMSPWFPRWHIGGTCLLADTDQGPVLVDSGLGLHDYTNPSGMVRFFIRDFGIHQDPEITAVRQVARLGYSPEDVRHIILTHLHFDHAGGLPDFPHAQVHVHRREVEAALHPRSLIELAYDKADFAHSPNWVCYEKPNAHWLGFEAMLLPFTPEMYLVPLFGHTRGHCGVALRDGEGWIFQCGDALPTNAQFDLTPGWLNRLVLGKHVAEIQRWAEQHPGVRLLAGHLWKDAYPPVS